VPGTTNGKLVQTRNDLRDSVDFESRPRRPATLQAGVGVTAANGIELSIGSSQGLAISISLRFVHATALSLVGWESYSAFSSRQVLLLQLFLATVKPAGNRTLPRHLCRRPTLMSQSSPTRVAECNVARIICKGCVKISWSVGYPVASDRAKTGSSFPRVSPVPLACLMGIE
jgi:hypothetical protein